MDLRNVVDGGDTVVELRQAADQFADVDILRPVVAGEAGRPRRSGQHVCEIVLLRARRARAVVDQDAVGNGASDCGPGLMVMRVDEAGHHDAAARIDHVGTAGVKVRADRENLLAFDQHVAAREIGNRRVHRHDGAAADEIAPAGTAAVARRAVVIGRGCGARLEQGKTRGGAGRRRAFQEVAPRGGMVLPPASIAQDAHVVASLCAFVGASHSNDGSAALCHRFARTVHLGLKGGLPSQAQRWATVVGRKRPYRRANLTELVF